MKRKVLFIGALVTAALIGGVVFIANSMPAQNYSAPASPAATTNVSVIDGQQIIEIRAKGGYSPRVTYAKANLPTVIKMVTTETFDCSSALIIRSVGFQNYLPESGITEIPVPAQITGTKLQGVCGMGMYNFAIRFD